MTGAMYAAIAGLKTHMSKLNVIGNNIANVNTYGYKSGRTIFQDALYTTSQSGSNGTSTIGGRNPSQIGYGVQIGSIDLDMSSGNYSPTGRGSDCMIDGDGFFLVGDKTTGSKIDPTNPDTLKNFTLSRVGSFTFMADGYLCDHNGNVVYGFLCTGYDETTGKATFCDQLVPIRMPMISYTTEGTGDQAKRISHVHYPVGPNAALGGGDAAAGDNAASGVLRDAKPGDDGTAETDPEFIRAKVDSITIDPSTGRVTAVTKDDDVVVVGYIALANVDNPYGLTHESGPYFKAKDGAGAVGVSMMGGAAADAGIQYVNGSLAGGNATGGADGTATLPVGMEVSNGGTTALITGGLEMSKTDLATEIAEMITTQRGYQANTRIITVTDSMLEELVNMKR